MKRPLFLAVLLTTALAVVIFAKWKLDQAIKEGQFSSEPVDTAKTPAEEIPNTIDIGIEQDPNATTSAAVHQATGSSKTDIMAALVSARQKFRSKAEVTSEAKKDPHSTPPTIIEAAETLGTLTSLEKQNPAYKPEFQAFYIECARDADVLTVTRVQCLENYVKSKGLDHAEVEKVLVDIDPTVKQLYREMTR
ncbi:MAG: hypothetical protein EOP10_08030 [Proteobacteria bacterium]|nr:MAG: hypothetical protein EOP10_08030 [Pseudomonadota bacterium]